MPALENETSQETNIDLSVPDTFTLDRVFQAPRELVWRALTKPEHLAEWYGPNGFRCETEALELRPGGEWKFAWVGPDGARMPSRIVFLEIDPPSRLVSEQAMSPTATAAEKIRRVTTLREVEGGTRLTLNMIFASADAREAALKRGGTEGSRQILARLAAFLESAQAGEKNA